MNRGNRLPFVLFVSALGLARLASAAGHQVLPGHVPEAVRQSRAVEPLIPGAEMRLAVGLQLRNQDELNALIADITNPRSANFRHYLTPEQFTERFGPTEQQYDSVLAFVRSKGLTVAATHPNRMIVDVTGTASTVERAFNIRMMMWEHLARGAYYAPDREPSFELDVPIAHISGLDNFVIPHPMNLKTEAVEKHAQTTTGSGPYGLYIGNDLRTAYAGNVSVNGAGQSVGLFELDGFFPNDVAANFQAAGLPAVPVKTVLLDGFSGLAGNANLEVILDIMMASYMAPGLQSVIVYEGYNWDDVLNKMATDNVASQLSCSWVFSPVDATTEQIFLQMIAQGQSFFQASGDSGGYTGWIMPPADEPNVTVVGGTSLTTNGAGGAWKSETTWSDGGGGVSQTYPIPSYQQGMNLSALGGSSTMRNIPDVSMLADVQLYMIFNNGQQTAVGGTSAAAPLWAGFLANANQQASQSGLPRIGFLNPLLYTLGNSNSLGSDLHDITTGNNYIFSAVPGYDLATGWGTPNGQTLVNALTSPPPPSFSLVPAATKLTIAAGASASETITINDLNGFSGAVNLVVAGLPNGVTGSFGSASATASSTLVLSASSSVTTSTSTVTVTGTSGNLTVTTTFALTVTSAAKFSLSASPASVTVKQGASGTSSIAIKTLSGFSGKVALAASGLPSGVTASFSSSSTSTTSTVTFTASPFAATGTSDVTIAGTNAGSSATATVALTINPGPNFTLAASVSTLSFLQGKSGTAGITITPQNGFNSKVNLTVSGLPSGVTGSFSPSSTTTTSTLTLTASPSAPATTATIEITAASGVITNQATISLTINPTPNFTLSATPASLTMTQGGSVTSTIAVNPVGGFNGTVTLTASGLPSGVTASFSGNTLTMTAASSAKIAKSSVIVTGKSGSLTALTQVALSITGLPDFALTAAPSSLRLLAGFTANTVIGVNPLNGFTAAVSLATTGLPNGVTAAFNTTASGLTLLTLSAPANSPAATAPFTVTATSGNLTHSLSINLTVTAPLAGTTPVDLTQSFNVTGIATDGTIFSNSGGLDNGGRSYSGSLLNSTQTAAGVSFVIGPPSAPDVISSAVVTLPTGQYNAIRILASGINGNQKAQTFIVNYADGTTATFTQNLSDWFSPQNYSGETKALAMNYRDNSVGTSDGRTFYLYGYSFALNTNETVTSITLPNNRNVVVLAVTLVSSGSLAATTPVNLSGYYDTVAITSDGSRFATTGGIDGVGSAYSATLLGASQNFGGALLSFGPADAANSVSGTGKPVTLPTGNFSSLVILGTGVEGSQQNQTFKITYSDGTSTTCTQSLSDWFVPKSYSGETMAVTMPYRNVASGVKDNRTFQLYGYSVQLNNAKGVVSIVLPNNKYVKILAMTLVP